MIPTSNEPQPDQHTPPGDSGLVGRAQIIALGKVLADEQQRGYDDQAVAGGLAHFLAGWRSEGEAALIHPAVRHALRLLDGYADVAPAQRQQRLDTALHDLRALFRKSPAEAPDAPAPKLKARAPRKPPAPPVPVSATELTLRTPIAALPGVTRPVAAAFKRLGLHTAEDLLYHYPHRYDDYSAQKRIADLEIGATETVVAEVSDARTFRTRNGREAAEVLFSDSSGTLRVIFWGGHWILKQLRLGRVVVLSGKIQTFQGQRQMTNPKWEPYTEDELVHTGRLVPVHPLTKNLHENRARQIIKLVVDHAAPQVADPLPDSVRTRLNMLRLPEALAQIHFPASEEDAQHARRRLAFDEFLRIQLAVLQRRLLWQSEMGYAMQLYPEVHAALLRQLSFALTGTPADRSPQANPDADPAHMLPGPDATPGSQVAALAELFHDIQRHRPMARLLQGDVGSGKTVVAAAVLLQVIANGLQGALMAPTEILAEQHYNGLRTLLGQVPVPREEQEAARAASPGADWEERLDTAQQSRLWEIKELLGMTPEDDLDGRGVRVALLTGSLGAKARRRVLEGISSGEVDLVVGTHALITEGVHYHNLGLVCVDEQHRFGTEQRQRLKQKGFNPHMLVMTATPIPRTLTLTIYGELDTSLITLLPPGRQEIKTRWVTRTERDKAYRHMRREIDQGRQAFVICPLVEESDKVDLPSAEEMHERLQHEVFPDLRVGLIHGRLLPREKDQVMRAFRDHAFDILVATAVVEVGIDVPNATTIMIEGAERFGLAQLHQFRGRVGRGAHQSYCILVSDVDNEATAQRLSAMEQTRDGFKLAEIDLELRGPGEFLGARQSGLPDLKIANLADTALLVRARQEAERILQADPELARPEHALLRAEVHAFQAKLKQSAMS